jgi:energy-coupling factor transporter ATP-binding protein EcfA2
MNTEHVNGQAGTGAGTPAPVQQTTEQPCTGYRSKTAGFHKAFKAGAKARVALIGVSGSGKSYTMLTLARALAGPTGKVACIDTEHGSLSKYAHSPDCPANCSDPSHFVFDVDEPNSYATDYLLDQLTFAEKNGYAVFCVDSLSHFWMGKDGALEFVDNAKKRTRDHMEGWKMFRPHEREMVDRFIGSPCHVIVTMRTKTDYEEQIKPDGTKKRVKVGLAPVQREGLEYEFDLVCSMDDENNLVIDKTRCSIYTQEKMRVTPKPGSLYFQPFIEWLDGPVIERIQPAPAETPVPHPLVAPSLRLEGKPWHTAGEMRRLFQAIREQIGETAYLTELANANVYSVDDFLAIRPVSMAAETALQCYNRMLQISQKEAA